MDCGPACLRMVVMFYGVHLSLEHLRQKASIGKDGVSVLGINEAAQEIGFRTRAVALTYDQLVKEAPLPCIVHWNQNHFVVVTPTANGKKVAVADPGKGMITYPREEFLQHWSSGGIGMETGIALLLEPTPDLYRQQEDAVQRIGWNFLLKYLWQYKGYLFQVGMSLLLAAGLQLVFPFLTQSIVDNGIAVKNLQFIYLILGAQFALFLGKAVVELLRSRLLLYISTHVNVALLSDFWIKMMKLPLSFYDTKLTGDILQRVNDHRRIETFLTGSTLNVFFSFISLLIFSIVLLIYNWQVFAIFAAGSLLYFGWIKLFFRQRRNLDHKRFEAAARENSTTMQLILGMQEIKINNAENIRRWEWENTQAKLFKLNFKNLSLNQYQQAGALFLNEGKNILITFFVAKAVLDGQLTLGAMLAVQYIIGQMNSPVEQLISFSQQAQEARMSLERLNEIHGIPDESPADKPFIKELPEQRSIHFNNLSFTYAGAMNEPVLKDIQLSIPQGKVTAIVGMSGSGKTTLLKLLLRFYEKYTGDIRVGDTNLQHISAPVWRSSCGAVMQDGFIFNDTVARNIAVSEEVPDYKKLVHACKVANILSFVESLPLSFNTIIGHEGTGISQGQRQRLLIARAVYKDPEYIFFDEATNALDANNERVIMNNLQDFFKERTVVVVAHRLSTVRNADHIIVLNKGVIVERGLHEELVLQQGQYYQLVKNQLELGN